MADGDVLQLDHTQPGGSGSIEGQDKFKWGAPPAPAAPLVQTGFPPYDAINAENANFTLGDLVELPQGGTAEAMVVWFDSGPAGNAKAAIYQGTGDPLTLGNLLAFTAGQALVPGRNVFTFAGEVLPAGPLWIMVKMDNNDHLLGSGTGAVTGIRGSFSNLYGDPFPNPAPALDFDDVNCYSMSLIWRPT